jgi:polyhydroxyalkanoate synthesis repressor PhaR
MTPLRIIKKYPNRRLYDTERGVYITLDDIKQLVLDRVDFQVLEARTNKDLTQSTLLQIISEHEASSTPLFTTSILRDFIRFYHEKSQTLFSQYLEQAMHLFIQQHALFKQQWQAYPWTTSTPKESSKKSKKDKNK